MSYASAVKQAQRQIGSKGRTITLRRVTQGTYSAASDTLSGAGTTDKILKAVFTEFKDDEIDGDRVIRGDKMALIAAGDLAGVPPAVNDTILDGTTQYKILDLKTVAPGDTDILYKIHIRK